jgi:hypothetical protein
MMTPAAGAQSYNALPHHLQQQLQQPPAPGGQLAQAYDNYTYGHHNNNRSLSPYGGTSTPAAFQMAAASSAGSRSVLDQMAAAGLSQQQQLSHHHHQDATTAATTLEELFMMGAFPNPFGSTVPVVQPPGTSSIASMYHTNSNTTMGTTTTTTTQSNHHHGNLSSQHAARITSHPSMSQQQYSNNSNSSPRIAEEPAWMKEITLSVPSLSLQPLTGSEIVKRIKSCMQDVIRRYIPCVDFLVQCQQELRKGIQAAQIKPNTGGSSGGRRGSAGYRGISPRQFYSSYIEGLPNRFYLANDRRMGNAVLQEALQGLQKLRTDAKNVMNQGCEAMKNSFLGGMKEGESWGLRRWLSKNGNALRVCTDLECILKACKELDNSKDATKQLAAFLRPLAKQTLDKLKRDIPASYQERSSAHPYLPFFHRLEAALRNMSQFDPEDDGVICLDDSDEDDDEPIVVLPPSKQKPLPRKRKAAEVEEITIDVASPEQKDVTEPPQKKRVLKDDDVKASDSDTEYSSVQDKAAAATTTTTAAATTNTTATTITTTAAEDDSSSGESDLDSVIEIVRESVRKDKDDALKNDVNLGFDSDLQITPDGWGGNLRVGHANATFSDSSDDEESPSVKMQRKPWADASHRFPMQPSAAELSEAQSNARSFAHMIRRLVETFQTNDEQLLPSPAKRARFGKKNQFWDLRYHEALRIFSDLLFHPEAMHFIDAVDELGLMRCGYPSYGSIIMNPLCFRDIVTSLIDEDSASNDSNSPPRFMSGILPRPSLDKWNMWRGMDLLQALDLVLLNSLAYGRVCEEGKSKNRSRTNELRKQLWDRIQDVVNDNEYDAERRKRATPTRRAESSGFVVFKGKA